MDLHFTMFSINLAPSGFGRFSIRHLHFTMFSINPSGAKDLSAVQAHLHFTMFSINQEAVRECLEAEGIYISLCFLLIQHTPVHHLQFYLYLHFTMFSINRDQCSIMKEGGMNLHFTMFSINPILKDSTGYTLTIFTFHYVFY